MRQLILVMLGGALGSGARYLAQHWAGRVFGTVFPYGTVAINVVGSFLLVLLMQVALKTTFNADARIFLATGVLGGFTTYSSFNYEAIKLIQDGAPLYGALNIAATVILCLAAGALALIAARAIVGA